MKMLKFFFMILFVQQTLSALVVFPKSAIVLANSRVVFECAYDDQSTILSWTFASFENIRDHKTIFNGSLNENFRDRFRVETFSKNNLSFVNLEIEQVNLNDAGYFSCSFESEYRGAYLAVLKSSPQCSISIPSPYMTQSDTANLRCNVTVTGIERTPDLKFITCPFYTKTYSKIENNTFFIGAELIPYQNAFGATTCTFQIVTITKNTWSIGGVYRHTWSHDFLVARPVQQLEFNINNGSKLVRGKIIKVSSESYPVPSYQWINVDSQKTYHGDELKLASLGNYSFQCIATNKINGIDYRVSSNLTFEVVFPSIRLSSSRVCSSILLLFLSLVY